MNIKEASARTGVPSATIRYYEKEGLIPAIDRSDVGVREIDDRIIRRINFAKQMRGAGMSIEALRRYIQLFDAQENNLDEQKTLLQEQLAIMEEKRDDLQAAIDHLHWKLDHFDDHMVTTEEELRNLEKGHADSQD
ncbi:MerR family transcriptional regulator [Lacticaseibacillus songhuajiangensis]|jgi:DNA-binding transcriptional MerR regulator|uniref:MerR family transcriptional regulator n=1 Tax=Lacticaseibacillus songhuajiangensis TaxID=1296539 RepID=UPI000F79A0CD|nr:MerR family transcriptional regulator [Lacticaseibacillus songhuajiangensis]